MSYSPALSRTARRKIELSLTTRIANLSTVGLYHYPSQIVNESTTTAWFNFAPNEQIDDVTVGGVINVFESGREQMALFVTAGNWSMTNTYLSHAWLQWGTRGIVQGFRRIYMQTQSMSSYVYFHINPTPFLRT